MLVFVVHIPWKRELTSVRFRQPFQTTLWPPQIREASSLVEAQYSYIVRVRRLTFQTFKDFEGSRIFLSRSTGKSPIKLFN
jgi:hypothetical protein